MGNFNYQAVADTVANNTDRQMAAGVGQFLNTALQVYQQHLQQQKLDTLANTLMAADNAKTSLDYDVAHAAKAKPVQADDPEFQGTPQYNEDGGPVYHYTDGSSPGSPPSSGQEAQHNADLGYSFTPGTPPAAPGTIPATGGYAGLQMKMAVAHSLVQDQLAQEKKEHLMSILSGGGSGTAPASGLVNTPYGKMTPYQASTSAHRDSLPVRGAGASVGPKQQYDSPQKLNSDLQFRWGHDYSEFRDAGPDDTVQQPGGVLYRMGGDKKGPDGKMLPKQNVFLPQADVDQMNARVNGLLTGRPTVLNAAQAMYQQRLGAPSATATTAPAAVPADAAQQAANIKAQVRAGTLSADQAITQLQALGFD